MGFWPTLAEIARQTAVRLLQSRMYAVLLLALAGVAVLAALLGIGRAGDIEGRNLYAVLCWWLVGNVLVPWTTMYFAVQAMHGDIEDRTFQYLFLRPVPRAAILLGKWLAVATVCGLTAALGALLVFAGVALHRDLWPTGVETSVGLCFAGALFLMAVVFAAVAAFFAVRCRWPLVWSTGYVLAAQFVLANLPARASVRSVTVGDPVRRLVFAGIDPDRRLSRMLWPFERHWSEDLVGRPLVDLAAITAVALVLALFYYVHTEYDSRPRE